MKTKSEARQHLTNFISFIKTQFNRKLKCLRSDNGPEFLTSDFYQAKGIIHHRSCVETSQQNDIVERKHQHILNVARTLSFQSKIPISFWHFSVQQAMHIINRIPSPLLHNKSPYELLHKQPPTLLQLRVFGCLAFASTIQQNRSKFHPRARKSVKKPKDIFSMISIPMPFSCQEMLFSMKVSFLFLPLSHLLPLHLVTKLPLIHMISPPCRV